MKEKRKALSQSEIKNKSRAVCTAFVRLREFLEAKTVCLYMSISGEVDTSFIIEECKNHGKEIVVPVVNGKEIFLSRFSGDMEKGTFGILEPLKKESFPKEMVDIFVVPALAFDASGGRIGFGKGYYDKLLFGTEGTKVGICYDFQLMEKLSLQSHDVKMDYVVCETGIFGKGQS